MMGFLIVTGRVSEVADLSVILWTYGVDGYF